MSEIFDILQSAIERGGSDVFIIPGSCVRLKVSGEVQQLRDTVLRPDDTRRLIKQVYELDNREMDRLTQHGDDDFSFSISGVGRFRCNAYQQRNSLAMVLRVVSLALPNPQKMHIPDEVLRLADIKKGLVLVTGPAASGKSTTLACIIDRINTNRHGHIITIEDPIEFIHAHKASVLSQREIEHDTVSYQTALRAALRQAPDVILLGEMRDLETIQTALTAAETGQLVLSTLHTVGAAKTIDRIIDVFPANQQQQIRVQLSMVLRAVVSQQLLPAVDGGLEPAFEIMLANSAIQNMIRDAKAHQMDNVIFSGQSEGMRTMDGDIMRLYHQKRITRETALLFAANPEQLKKKLAE
ncbi:MAG: type IV pili twitching motility protein PilT [Clostridiales bacterium]|nr:type IV pili twitching motility protein PilT [Clostridiales bacterium]